MPIELSAEEKKQALASIRRFCAEELEIDVGDLKADSVLRYFLAELAPSVYNAAIGNAQAYFRDRAADLEGVCFAPPFGYWPKPPASRRSPAR